MSFLRRAAVVASVLAIGVALAPPAGHAARDTARTKAARPQAATEYAVGARNVVLVDRERTTDANGTYAGAPDRTLPVVVLYPAVGTPGPATIPDARPARKAGPFPLVVFSHGFTASGPAYREWLIRRVAAHGYVVAAPTFPLSNGQAPGGPKLVDYVNQPADVSFVITKMLAANRGRGPLGGLIAPKQIGAMGHSLGAITTLGVTYNRCCLDRRIKAAVPISGLQLPFGSSSWAWPPVPLLLIHGDQDRTVPVRGSIAAYADAQPPKYLVTLHAAPHTPVGQPYLDIVVNSTNDFFDRYLRGERAALARLTRDANVPLASSLQADLH
jgi:predicted dienelactone hydrolase